METKIQFKKYSGNGNDFVVLDHPSYPVTAELVQALCNRHFGIGGDGVLVLTSEAGFDGRMRIFNADGGEAEMCGNGIRCLVTYLYDSGENKKDSYKIKTMNGSYEVSRREGAFAVEMSEINDKNIYDLSIFNEYFNAFYVNTGVPHLVFMVHDVKRIDIKSRAPQYRFHKLFPNGTNVSFLQVLEGEQTAYVRTYERGVEDETLSCGTGLTAAGLALNHWLGWKGNINLKTLGGTQRVSIGEKIFYAGEVKFCFQGEFTL
ncbi:MAG: diaminopimelate epimerase [Bacteriovoracaceae bacterium]|nr:diaminopimelate epimerase [Bacteriovoracaceae bacterium]